MDEDRERDLQALDTEIVKLQKSTRTTVPAMLPLHDILRQKFRWYYKWSLWPFSKVVHALILLLFVGYIGLIFYHFSFSGPGKTMAASDVDFAPNAAGDSTQWTANGSLGCGATNWCVTTTNDTTTSYVSAAVGVSLTDLYNLSDSTQNGPINSVTVYFVASTGTTAGLTISPVIKENGTTTVGTAQGSISAYPSFTVYDPKTWTTKPSNGAAWTWTDINNLQAGVQNGATGGPAYVTQVYADVNYSPGITISGNIYQSGSESTLDTTAYTIAASTANGAPYTTTAAAGSYSLTVPGTAGQVIAVYIQGGAYKANTFTVTDGTTNATSVNLYDNKVAVGNNNGTGTTTNANICTQTTYPTAADNLFTCPSGNLTITTNDEFHILNGKKYDTGASSTLITQGTGILHIDTGATATITTTNSSAAGGVTITSTGTLVLASTVNFNVGGSFANSGTFTANSSTVTFNATASGYTLSGTMTGSSAFYNLTFAGSGGGWTLSNNLTATALTLTTGTLVDNGVTVTVNGSISIGGTLTSTGFWIQGAPGGNISDGTSGNAFRNLTIAGTGVTTTLTGNVYVGKYNSTTNTGLTIGAATPGTLNGGTTHYIELLTEVATNVLTINNVTMGTPLNAFILQTYTNNATLSALTLPSGFATSVVLEAYSSSIAAGGNLNFGNNNVYICSNVTGTTQPTYYVNMATYSLTTTGTLYLGWTTGNLNGKLELGTNVNHSVGGLNYSGTGTGNVLDMSVTSPNPPTITVSGDVNFTNFATVTAGTSTLVMNGATKNLIGNGQTLNSLQISGNTTATTSDVSVGGTLTVDNSKALTIDTGRTMTMNAGSTTTINGTIGANTTGLLKLVDTAGANLGVVGTLSANVQFNAHTASVTVPNRTYGGAVTFLNDSGSAYNATLSAGTHTYSSTFTVSTTGAGGLTVSGTNNPTVNITGDVTFTQSSSGGPSITMYSGASPNPWAITGNLTLANGSINLGSVTTTVSGDVNLTSGTVTPGTSTLIMNGNGNTLTPSGQTLNNFEMANNITLGGDLTTNGYLKIDSGKTLDATNRTLNIAGDFNNAGGTLTSTNSTVNLTGAGGSTQTISGSTTFNNLSATGSSARTIKYTDGTTQIVSGTWTMTGAAEQLITLTGTSTAGWTINPTAATVDYADVSYSSNNGVVFCATHSQSTNGGNGGSTGWKITLEASCAVPTLADPTITNNNTGVSVTFNGNITDTGGVNATERGFKLYAAADNTCSSTILLNPHDNGSYGTGAFNKDSGATLSYNTNYYYTAYAINVFGLGTSSCQSFTTPVLAPTMSVSAATNNTTGISATLNGGISATNGANATERGFNYYAGLVCGGGSLGNPKDTGGSYGVASFSKDIAGLSTNTAYSYTAYAINSGGTGTSSCQSFTTPVIAPTLADPTISNNTTGTSVTFNSNITDIGGSNATERGFKLYAAADNTCSSTILMNPHDSGSYGTGVFSKDSDQPLTPNTSYNYTAYAINPGGTGTSSCQSFTTPNYPSVTVSGATGISATAATLNGNITDTGTINPTERGFKVYTDDACSSTILQNPHENGGGYSTGIYSLTTTDALSPHTDYWYTAYAINTVGTGTSNTCEKFTTIDTTITLSAQAATAVTNTSATMNGTLVSAGGVNVTRLGFNLYSNDQNCGGVPSESHQNGSYGDNTVYSLPASSLVPNTYYSYKSYGLDSGNNEVDSPTCQSFLTLA